MSLMNILNYAGFAININLIKYKLKTKQMIGKKIITKKQQTCHINLFIKKYLLYSKYKW